MRIPNFDIVNIWNDIYELQINDEMNEMNLAVWKQFKELHFLAWKKKIQGYNVIWTHDLCDSLLTEL